MNLPVLYVVKYSEYGDLKGQWRMGEMDISFGKDVDAGSLDDALDAEKYRSLDDLLLRSDSVEDIMDSVSSNVFFTDVPSEPAEAVEERPFGDCFNDIEYIEPSSESTDE